MRWSGGILDAHGAAAPRQGIMEPIWRVEAAELDDETLHIFGAALVGIASPQESLRPVKRVGRLLRVEEHPVPEIPGKLRRAAGVNVALLAVLASMALAALGCTGDASSDVPKLEQRAYSLNQAIMCPVCPGESIDQSQNPLAVQMRAIVIDKLTEGSSGQQIKDFFVERYGPSVLLAPPSEGLSLAAWIVPPVVMLAAVIALLLALRRMHRSPPPAVSDGSGQVALTMGEREQYFRRIEAALELEEESDNAG